MQNQTETPHRLVAVVVTYNRCDHLEVTLARLFSSSPQVLAKVIVVDNASTDRTRDWLSTVSDPRLDTVLCDENRGGAGGFATGMLRAMEVHAPDWLVLMDDDGRPAPGALEAFCAKAHHGWDAVAAAVYYPSGKICEMNRPSVNPLWSRSAFFKSLWKLRDGYHIPLGDYDLDQPRPIDLTSFVGFFVRASVVRDAGLPDPSLFLYGDDVIYTLGLRRRGYAIAFDPQIRFEHDCETFDNDAVRVFRPIWKVYYAYRNGLMMYHLALGPLFWLLVPLLWAKWMFAARRYDGQQATYKRLFFRAFADGIRGRTKRTHPEVVALVNPDRGKNQPD